MTPIRRSAILKSHDVTRYEALLRKLQRDLHRRSRENGLAADWAARLTSWIAELQDIRRADDKRSLQAHVARTRKAFGGMRSLNDIAGGTELSEDLFETTKALELVLSGDERHS